MKNSKEKYIHSGHRSRLRNRVKKYGLDSLNDHEVLELLLGYAIPRKDTNPLAHNLINYFGSFAKVIDADFYDLLKVNGVGEETAVFIKVLSSFMPIYKESKAKEEDLIIKNTFQAVNYFRKRFEIKDKEFMHVICLSKTCKLVSSFSFDGKNDAEINFDFKTFMDKINKENVHSVMMFHTHPNGGVEPSEEDLKTTQRCVHIASLCGIKFLDHLIFNETEYSSMFQLGHIADMLRKSNVLISYSSEEANLVKKQNVDLSDIDLGDVSIEDKLKKRKK